MTLLILSNSPRTIFSEKVFPDSFFTKRHTLGVAIQLVVFILIASLLQPATVQAASLANNLELQPHPSLTPQEVVEFQLAALQDKSGAGIEATFRFASPANKVFTGPLARFSRLFDSPQYQPMLENKGTEIKLISNDGVVAELLAGVVDGSGDLHWYRFKLSRQTESPYVNCWMTDGVAAVAHPGRSA